MATKCLSCGHSYQALELNCPKCGSFYSAIEDSVVFENQLKNKKINIEEEIIYENVAETIIENPIQNSENRHHSSESKITKLYYLMEKLTTWLQKSTTIQNKILVVLVAFLSILILRNILWK